MVHPLPPSHLSTLFPSATMPLGASSVRSEDSEGYLENSEMELSRLQRQCRVMEAERQAYTKETQQLIQKQMVEINRLQQEQAEIQTRMKIIQSQAQKALEQELEKDVKSLLARRQHLYREVIKEQQYLKKLDQEIAKWEAKVLEQQKELRGTSLVMEKKAQGLHRVKILENQLDRANTRFDTQLVKNRILREEMTLLHTQRKRFLHLDQQLRKELSDIRANIRSHIDNSNMAFDAR
ncbi:outer dynein arm-docking complex subunit 1-like isoform X1 [Gracilinanus agilis]|uniref:outer dynein arm-docking complex subunit 1-like isoform X1 n=2 Tax=Gracilinanus agilis TaxID=191870 RepID=UPI001CFCF78B|nr:outer dynein arm-docking complex subunit 1-like isoform X1 [Gracilinanus agilis]